MAKGLENIHNNPQTVHFFQDTDTPYFFLPDRQTAKIFLQLHKDQWEFDSIFNSFSVFGQKQLVQSFLIDEIQSTNKIENIQSTRHDIFDLIQKQSNNSNKKLRFIVNGYLLLLNENEVPPSDLKEVRQIYDQLLKGAVEKENKPDGELFRKNPVYITNGLKNVHRGFWPEEAVNRGMQEFLDFYNDQNSDLFERLIISHFLIETIHPFYDGNGRLGRFLLIQKYFRETGSYLAFAVSTALNKRKSAYYIYLLL